MKINNRDWESGKFCTGVIDETRQSIEGECGLLCWALLISHRCWESVFGRIEMKR